jgi:hypothetical protein
MKTIEAKEVLRKQGYFVDNLWSVEDVTDQFDCTDEVAQEILYKALTHPWMMERIHEMIHDIAFDYALKEKGGDQ